MIFDRHCSHLEKCLPFPVSNQLLLVVLVLEFNHKFQVLRKHSFVHQHLLLVLGSVKCISDGGVEVGDNVPVKVQNPARGQDCPACVVMMLVEVMSLVLVMVVFLISCGKKSMLI